MIKQLDSKKTQSKPECYTLLCTGRVLTLTLKKKWFDMIASGEKKEEYREIKEYWKKRLENNPQAPFVANFKKFDRVLFKNGYSRNAPTLIVECLGIDCGDTKPEWCGGVEDFVYVIKLGKVLFNSTEIKPCA